MSETIDDLLVKLGLETDAESFKEGERMFSGIRSKALAFGAVVGGLSFGVKKLTDNFARETDAQGKFAQVYGASAQYVDALGYALERQGGSADEAFSSIKRIRDLMEATEWGEIPSDAFRVAGFDPMLLQGVTDVASAYERIADASARLDPEARRRALSSLGFGDSEIRLFSGGSGGLNDLLAEAQKLAPVTQEMVGNAEAYTDAQARLAKAVEGITDIIGNKLAPSLTDAANMLANFLGEHREDVGNFVQTSIDATSAEFEGIAKWWEAVQNGDWMEASRRAVQGGLYVFGAEDYIKRAQEREEEKARGMGLPAGVATGAPSSPVIIQGGTQTNRYEFNVDARGSTDPRATEDAVERGVYRALEKAGNAAVDRTESPSK